MSLRIVTSAVSMTGWIGSIAVRDPYVSWDGTRALFSMVVGAPQAATATPPSYFWQIYEVSGLGKAQTPVISDDLCRAEHGISFQPESFGFLQVASHLSGAGVHYFRDGSDKNHVEHPDESQEANHQDY